jgi:hypothetical protein
MYLTGFTCKILGEKLQRKMAIAAKSLINPKIKERKVMQLQTKYEKNFQVNYNLPYLF